MLPSHGIVCFDTRFNLQVAKLRLVVSSEYTLHRTTCGFVGFGLIPTSFHFVLQGVSAYLCCSVFTEQ